MNRFLRPVCSTYFILSFILLTGLFLRFLYLQSFQHAPDFDSPVLDPQLNDYWARALLTGDWTPPPHADNPQIQTTPYGRPPGYPWLLFLMYKCSNGSYLFPRVIQLIVGLFNIFLVFVLAQYLFSDSIGLAAALGMALFWGCPYFEGELNSPTWEVFFSLLMVLSVLKFIKTSRLWLLSISGLCLGLLSLIRPNMVLPGLALLLCLVWLLYRSSLNLKKIICSVVLFLGVAVAVIAPIIIRNWLVSGEFVFISYYGGINAYIGNNPHSTGTSPTVPDLYEISGVEKWNCFNYPSIVRGLSRHLRKPDLGFSGASRYFYGRALSFWKENPWQALCLTIRKSWLFWGPYEISDSKVVHYERMNSWILRRLLTFSQVLSLALLGFLLLLIARTKSSEFLHAGVTIVLAFIIGYFLSILPFFVSERYRFPVVPFLLPFAGLAVQTGLVSIYNKRVRLCIGYIVAMVIIYKVITYPLVYYSPDLSTWHLHRGIAHAARIRDATAVESFLAAIAVNALNDEAYLQLGYIKAAQGDHEEAVRCYKQALEANPENVYANNNLGYEFYVLGKYSEAEYHFRRALSRQPIFTLALNNLGNVLVRTGRVDEALQCFEYAKRINPNDPFAQYNIGNAYLERGEFAEAIAAYHLAFEAQPFNPNIANNLGLAYAKKGELEEAIQWFNKALQLAPDYTLAHFNLGNVYGDLGMGYDACHHYQQVLERWPNHEETKKRYSLLCSQELY